MSAECALCESATGQDYLLQSDTCFFMHDPTIGPRGCGIIAPFRHVRSVFELSELEWQQIHPLLLEARAFFDGQRSPEGYNVGWNDGPVAGQELDHVRMFVIPRWSDEPLAGRGLRYRLKQPENRRRSGVLDDAAMETLASNENCRFVPAGEPTLVGSGVILSQQKGRETVFDLTPEEWSDTYRLLQDVKLLLDDRYRPDGYTLGWNCGRIAGQEVFHVHMHVIPRYRDEPLAGKGFHHLLW